jgi:hypothetical protein
VVHDPIIRYLHPGCSQRRIGSPRSPRSRSDYKDQLSCGDGAVLIRTAIFDIGTPRPLRQGCRRDHLIMPVDTLDPDEITAAEIGDAGRIEELCSIAIPNIRRN